MATGTVIKEEVPEDKFDENGRRVNINQMEVTYMYTLPSYPLPTPLPSAPDLPLCVYVCVSHSSGAGIWVKENGIKEKGERRKENRRKGREEKKGRK